jgi:hypothetical protein
MMKIFPLLFQFTSSVDTDACIDDPDFLGTFGEHCPTWETRDCTSRYWNLGLIEMRILTEKCPKSCRQCKDNKVKKQPLLQHPKDCQDDEQRIQFCWEWSGFYCHLVEDTEVRSNLLRHCRRSCGICKPDYSQLPTPQECKFPFRVINKWYNSCQDTVGVSSYTFTPNNLVKELYAWCPTELKEDRTPVEDGFILPCYLKREQAKRRMYERCVLDTDCRSGVCGMHSDGKKRCRANSKTLCDASDGPGECPLGNTCNPHGKMAIKNYDFTDFQAFFRTIKRVQAEIKFRRTDPTKKIKPTESEIRTIMQKKYENFIHVQPKSVVQTACIKTERIMQPLQKATNMQNICIANDATVVCNVGEYCNKAGRSQSEMCVSDLTSMNKNENFIFDRTYYYTLCAIIIAISVIFFILIKIFKKIRQINLEDNQTRNQNQYKITKEYMKWESTGKWLQEHEVRLENRKGWKVERKNTCPDIEKNIICPIPDLEALNGSIKTETSQVVRQQEEIKKVGNRKLEGVPILVYDSDSDTLKYLYQ